MKETNHFHLIAIPTIPIPWPHISLGPNLCSLSVSVFVLKQGENRTHIFQATSHHIETIILLITNNFPRECVFEFCLLKDARHIWLGITYRVPSSSILNAHVLGKTYLGRPPIKLAGWLTGSTNSTLNPNSNWWPLTHKVFWPCPGIRDFLKKYYFYIKKFLLIFLKEFIFHIKSFYIEFTFLEDVFIFIESKSLFNKISFQKTGMILNTKVQ